jgi:hypothetical protein
LKDLGIERNTTRYLETITRRKERSQMKHRLFTDEDEWPPKFMVECDGLITDQYEEGVGFEGTVHCSGCDKPLIDFTVDTGQHAFYQWQVTKVYPHVDASAYKERMKNE